MKPMPSPAILSIDIPDLVRVREVEISDEKRGFYASCRDGSTCYVTCWKDRLNNHAVFCHKHGNSECEGAFRVKLVLDNEKYRAELLKGLEKIAPPHITNYALALVGDDVA